MRVILAAAAVLAALTVSSCDINTSPRQAKVECNCPPAPPPAGMRPATTPPASSHHHDRHRYARSGGYTHWSGGHSYDWRKEYSEVSVVTYDYRSGSHAYEMEGGSSGAYAYAESGAYTGSGAYAGAQGGWVDGYGRGHGGATAGAPVHYDSHGGARLKPWHGYDADCPDRH